MAELKCGVENCCYNQECYCCKGDIMVGGQHADTSRGPVVKVLRRTGAMRTRVL